jgi:hypothetical protein
LELTKCPAVREAGLNPIRKRKLENGQGRAHISRMVETPYKTVLLEVDVIERDIASWEWRVRSGDNVWSADLSKPG